MHAEKMLEIMGFMFTDILYNSNVYNNQTFPMLRPKLKEINYTIKAFAVVILLMKLPIITRLKTAKPLIKAFIPAWCQSWLLKRPKEAITGRKLLETLGKAADTSG